MTTPTLTELVQDGTSSTRLFFGRRDPVAAGRIAEAGARLYASSAPAPTVAVVMTNDQPTVEILLGAITVGTTVVSLPLPGRGADLDSYAGFIRQVCDRYGAAEVIARDDIAELAAGVGLPARSHSALRATPLAAPNREGEFRLVQFSSGSTQQPKPIDLGDEQLGANVAAMLHTVDPEPGNVTVSWLPLSHDMGLVGMLVTSLVAAGHRWAGRGDIVLLDPGDFMRHPSLWLEALSAHRGAVTAAPDFAYRMATRRPPRHSIDLSALRCAIVGGEIIRADTLGAFFDCFADNGLVPSALCPAYGLAEVGLAVTITPPEHRWRQRSIATGALADGRLPPPGAGEPSVTFAASGPPLTGYQIKTTGGDHTSGSILVRGPSIGINGTTGGSFANRDGWLHTGDTGFIDDGWLYVCGRTDDYIVAQGRNLYAPAIETQLNTLDHVRAGRVGAVGLPTGEWVVVAEPADDRTPVRQLRQDVRRVAAKVAAASPDEIVIVRRGTLPVTSSGKLQRNELRARLLRGTLDAHDARPMDGPTDGTA